MNIFDKGILVFRILVGIWLVSVFLVSNLVGVNRVEVVLLIEISVGMLFNFVWVMEYFFGKLGIDEFFFYGIVVVR